MTDTMTFQNIDLSSRDILYMKCFIHVPLYLCLSLDGGEWSASCSDKPQYPLNISVGQPQGLPE